MAPGVFMVWSRTDPTLSTDNGEADVSHDSLIAHSATSYGVKLQQQCPQLLSDHAHDIPYLAIYSLSEISCQEGALIQQFERGSRAVYGYGTFKFRFYEQILRVDAPDCEDGT